MKKYFYILSFLGTMGMTAPIYVHAQFLNRVAKAVNDSRTEKKIGGQAEVKGTVVNKGKSVSGDPEHEYRIPSMPAEFCPASEKEAIKYANDFLSLTKRKYEFVRSADAGDMLYITYKECGDAESPQKIEVAYRIKHEGRNIALEIEGTKKYYFRHIIAPYVDVFPMWQKYFAPKADIELSAKGGQHVRYCIDSEKMFYPALLKWEPDGGSFSHMDSKYRNTRWGVMMYDDRANPYIE